MAVVRLVPWCPINSVAPSVEVSELVKISGYSRRIYPD